MPSICEHLQAPIDYFCSFIVKIGKLGRHAIRWIVSKCTKIKKIDRVAKKKIQTKHEPMHSPTFPSERIERRSDNPLLKRPIDKPTKDTAFVPTAPSSENISAIRSENQKKTSQKEEPESNSEVDFGFNLPEKKISVESAQGIDSNSNLEEDVTSRMIYHKSSSEALLRFLTDLKENTVYSELILMGNDFAHEEVEAICDLIETGQALQELTLEGVNVDGIKKIIKSLARNYSLNTFIIKGEASKGILSEEIIESFKEEPTSTILTIEKSGHTKISLRDKSKENSDNIVVIDYISSNPPFDGARPFNKLQICY